MLSARLARVASETDEGMGNYSFPPAYWDHISEDAKDLVRHMLVVDPKERYTPEQALAHRWFATHSPLDENDLVTPLGD